MQSRHALASTLNAQCREYKVLASFRPTASILHHYTRRSLPHFHSFAFLTMSSKGKAPEAELISRPLHFKGGKVAPNRLAKVSLW